MGRLNQNPFNFNPFGPFRPAIADQGEGPDKSRYPEQVIQFGQFDLILAFFVVLDACDSNLTPLWYIGL